MTHERAEALTDVANQLLDLVAQQTGGEARAEVTVIAGQLSLTRFAGSFIHQNVAEATDRVRLRVHTGGRTAASSTTVTSKDALHGLAGRTIGAARLRPVDTGWGGLTPPSGLEGTGNYDPATAAAEPGERAAAVRAFVDAANGLETAGYVRTSETVLVYANSAGQRVAGWSTSAMADGIARTCSSDGVARAAAVRLGDLDPAGLGARAAAKARSAADPVPLAAGRYPVVLEPSAVADILQFSAWYGFNARAVAEGQSFVELGKQQFDTSITLRDDPLRTGALGIPVDAEGAPKRPLTLVADGVPVAVTHDRRTAHLAGAESTGHALNGGERSGPSAGHLCLRTGPADDLVAGLDRGLLVSDLWYTRVLDPRTLVVTGLTRNGVWWVENGELVRPVRNLRFTQSYLDALAPGAVLGVGSAAEAIPNVYGESSISAPGLLLESWNFTGGAAS
jgi:predicted Zn-dependent protease